MNMLRTVKDITEKILSISNQYNGNVLFAYFFGSAAQGNISLLSDVDLAIYFSKQDVESYYEIKCSFYADCCIVLAELVIKYKNLRTPQSYSEAIESIKFASA